MKTIISATAAFVLLATTAAPAAEAPPPQPQVQPASDSAEEAGDCSKQVWPDFSEACLRSDGKRIPVRLVTIERR